MRPKSTFVTLKLRLLVFRTYIIGLEWVRLQFGENRIDFHHVFATKGKVWYWKVVHYSLSTVNCCVEGSRSSRSLFCNGVSNARDDASRILRLRQGQTALNLCRSN